MVFPANENDLPVYQARPLIQCKGMSNNFAMETRLLAIRTASKNSRPNSGEIPV